MEHIWLPVLGLTALLAIAAAMLPAAKRLNFPYTVLLAALGCAIGTIEVAIGETAGLGIVSDFLLALRSFGGISSEVILFVFLPALIFESALAIDVRRLADDIAPILLLAVAGLLISTFVIGYTLWAVSGMALVACLLLGAIVSATDPVAVVAIFKDLRAPKRLAILVEGESLFNDATAIVLFTILAVMLTGGAEPSFLSGAWSFLKVFVGGGVVGYALAQVACYVIGQMRNLPLVEITLTISLAYLSFIVAEHYLHVSGVMAVVTAALVVGSTGRTAISPDAWHLMEKTWEQLGFWANSLIFVFVGIIVPNILRDAGLAELGLLAILLIAAFTARAAILYCLLPAFNRIGLSERVSAQFTTVMFWGGLRGAVSLALALAVIENPAVTREVQTFVGVLVTGFVLFTLFVNATTMKPMMSLLGLDMLSSPDRAIRDRAMALSLAHISDAIETVGAEYRVDPAVSRRVIEGYAARTQQMEKSLQELKQQVGDDEWLRIGLAALANQERKSCLEYYKAGYVSPPIARLLFAQIDDILDSLKTGGIEGYRAAVAHSLGFDWRFRLALRLLHHFGWTRLLTRALVNRFEVLLATIAALNTEIREGLPKVIEVIGDEVSGQLKQILEDRLDQTNQAFETLERQYPEYSKVLQECHLQRIAIRLEETDYKAMHEQAIISKEVLSHLEADLDKRARDLEQLPQLDLGLDPAQLIVRVPFFEYLDSKRIAEIAKLLKPRLAIPGEQIIRKGDSGDSMFFIASGAVDVDLEPGPVSLGSGDFFGEIALINDRPRVANVTAQCFCDLLVLYTRDFHTLLTANPEMQKAIRAVAVERLKSTDQLGLT